MKLRIFTDPQQGASYDQLLAMARTSEELGFEAFFRSDHYMRMGNRSGEPGPTDAWITLAGLARETSTIRLGTLMTCATFRLPGPLAISVAQVDQMSGGRIEFGFGAGWYEEEHTAIGIPFPSLRDRFARFEEQLEIITGVWAASEEHPYSFDGDHYKMADNRGLPHPQQIPRPPILIGGIGPTRTPKLAAKYADEFNVGMQQPKVTRDQFDRVARACEAIEREAGSMIYSVAAALCVAETESEYLRKAERINRDPKELRTDGFAGLVDEVIEKIHAYIATGATRAYLQALDFEDLDQLQLVAEQVVPAIS